MYLFKHYPLPGLESDTLTRHLNTPHMLADAQRNNTSGTIHTVERNDTPDAALKMLSPSSSTVIVPFCSSVNSLQTNSDLIDLSDKEVTFLSSIIHLIYH